MHSLSGNIYGLIVVNFYALHTQEHHHKLIAGEHLRYLDLCSAHSLLASDILT